MGAIAAEVVVAGCMTLSSSCTMARGRPGHRAQRTAPRARGTLPAAQCNLEARCSPIFAGPFFMSALKVMVPVPLGGAPGTRRRGQHNATSVGNRKSGILGGLGKSRTLFLHTELDMILLSLLISIYHA